jgi:hypothetical protein
VASSLSRPPIPNFTLFYAPMCCTSVTRNSNCVSISPVEYIVFLIVWLVVYLLVVLGDSIYVSCATVMSVYGVGCFLCRVDGVHVMLSSV